MDNDNTMQEILNSVKVCAMLTDLREKARAYYQSRVSVEMNHDLPTDVNCVVQATLDSYKAHQVYRFVNTIIELGKIGGDVDSIFRDLKMLF